MIAADGLMKRYGRLDALRGLSLRVPAGAVYGFIGPNGAGKTTTMRILAGLLLPDGGRAEVAGCDVLGDRRALHDAVGYMPDFFGVCDDLRVGEYLEFYAAAHGIRGPRVRKLRDDLLELVDLAAKRDALVEHLSRGMQQRLCLARALVHGPAVLLLDEPASGLDPLARVEMRELLKELGRMRKTVLISSHILSELADLCSHVGMVLGGRTVREGTVGEVLAGASRRRLQLRLHGAAAGAEGAVADWPGVSGVQVAGETQEFSLDGGLDAVAALLRCLVEAGLPVVHFAETERSLEDAYLELARGAGA